MPTSSAAPKKILIFFALSTFVLAVNVFSLSPWLIKTQGAAAANGLYIVIRVLIYIGFTFGVAYYANRNRFQSVSLGTALGFIDHAVLKAISIHLQSQADPQAWQGVTPDSILFNALLSYAGSFPILFLLCFIGSEIGLSLKAKKKLTDDGGKPPQRV